MRFIHNRANFVLRHLVLVDELDAVDAGGGELAYFGAGVGRSADTPPEVLGAGVRGVLDERAGDVERGTGKLPGVDRVSDVDAGFQRTAQVARARDPG